MSWTPSPPTSTTIRRPGPGSNGTPDQWGMVVNPAYKGIPLPVDQWPLLSTFEPTA